MTRNDALSAALDANAGQAVRAERLQNYSEFYVDTAGAESLMRNTNQLIFGRRGSGKTLLLGTLDDHIHSRFPHQKVLSFVYDATQFRISSGSDTTPTSVKEQTHAFFHAFIKNLCTDIVQLADDILFKKSTWLRELTLAGDSRAVRRDQLLASVIDLMDAVSYGVETPLPGDTKHLGEFVEHHESARSSDLGLSLGASTSHPPSAKVSYGGAISGSSRSEQTLT